MASKASLTQEDRHLATLSHLKSQSGDRHDLGSYIPKLQLDFLELISHRAPLGKFQQPLLSREEEMEEEELLAVATIVCSHICLKNKVKKKRRISPRMWTRSWWTQRAQRVLLLFDCST